MREYEKRNKLIRRLGWNSYKEYLKSDLWMRIRKDQLKRLPFCLACNGKATQVHHSEYTPANLLGHSPIGLISVCGDCHQRCEFTYNDVKRNPKQATRALGEIGGFLHREQWRMDEEYRQRLQRES